LSTRGDVLTGATRRIQTGCGNLYITINKNKEDIPIEVFVRLGKAGGCASCQTEAIGRLITTALRAGVPMGDITRQLKGIGCHQPVGFGMKKVLSCADAVAICLQDFIPITKEKT
jgi:ribonucleoside-diphosphate reductase alpha chain